MWIISGIRLSTALFKIEYKPKKIKMDKILNEKIGGRQRKLVVTDVVIKSTLTRDNILADKLILTCVSSEGQEFIIDEALLRDYKDNEIRSKGLWVSKDGEGHIRARSVIAKTMQHYNVDTSVDLINQEIIALPKRNNYLAIVIDSDITDEELPW